VPYLTSSLSGAHTPPSRVGLSFVWFFSRCYSTNEIKFKSERKLPVRSAAGATEGSPACQRLARAMALPIFQIGNRSQAPFSTNHLPSTTLHLPPPPHCCVRNAFHHGACRALTPAQYFSHACPRKTCNPVRGSLPDGRQRLL